jgi:predicted naringenin-chalcone synthase
MLARLLSVASAFPPHQADLRISTEHAQQMSCRTPAEAGKIEKLYRRTGVETRGSVLLEESTTGTLTQSFYAPLSDDAHGPTTHARNERFATEAPALAIQAAAATLTRGGCEAAQITHLITVTCTGLRAPGFDIELITGLGLSKTTQRIQIGFMGCHALINALRVARGLVAAEPDACVLIVSVELCSLHYQYGYNTQRIVSGSIFADGASACLVVGETFLPKRETETIGTLAATGSCLIPDSREAMTWLIGDHGFEMTLDASVPGLIESHLADFLVDWLAEQGETVDSIGGWAVHPGGTRILLAVQNAMNLPQQRLRISYDILRRHGNMSSATLGVVLEDFVQAAIPRPWLMLGFGPGLETEVSLIR